MSADEERAPLLSTAAVGAAEQGAPTSARRRNAFWTLGALYGASAVCLGAFGAHGLKKTITDPAKLASFSTAAHYQVSRRGQTPGHNPFPSVISVTRLTIKK